MATGYDGSIKFDTSINPKDLMLVFRDYQTHQRGHDLHFKVLDY